MAQAAASRPARPLMLVVALVVLAAIAAWFLRPDRPASASPPVVQAPALAPDKAPELLDLGSPREAPQRATVEAETSAPETAPESAPPAEPAPEVADLAARDKLTLRVVDQRDAPIFDAQVTIEGLRKEGDEGSWYSRRDDVAAVRTERDGRAQVPYERWTDIDAKTVRVDLHVEHPDFIPFHETSFVLAPGEHVIRLEQGAIVWLTAWHGSRDRVVPDVAITVEWQAQLGQDGWREEANGSWSTTRLAPGGHWITAAHSSSDLGSLASAFTPFEVAQFGRSDVELELKPLVTLRGRLDDAVPRPIVDGHVWLNLHEDDGSFGLSSDHQAPVAADGTFEIEGVRSASGQVIALCDGWVSKLVPPRTLAQTHVTLAPDATPEEAAQALALAQAEDRIAQPVDAGQAELVIEMERGGELEVLVTDEGGTALEGVHVSAWPNVHWKGVGSTIFPWRSWTSVTDAHGIARVANLPVDPTLWFGAQSATHQLRKADRDQNPSAVIESGKTTRFELVLEKIP
jgi:hypothetical protein